SVVAKFDIEARATGPDNNVRHCTAAPRLDSSIQNGEVAGSARSAEILSCLARSIGNTGDFIRDRGPHSLYGGAQDIVMEGQGSCVQAELLAPVAPVFMPIKVRADLHTDESKPHPSINPSAGGSCPPNCGQLTKRQAGIVTTPVTHLGEVIVMHTRWQRYLTYTLTSPSLLLHDDSYKSYAQQFPLSLLTTPFSVLDVHLAQIPAPDREEVTIKQLKEKLREYEEKLETTAE
ncbi:hypothetical protein BaRGS_00002603, partial [Batillaria attramentaria]